MRVILNFRTLVISYDCRESYYGAFESDYEYFMPRIKELILSGIAYSNKLFVNPVDKETKQAIDDTFLKADHHAINKLLKKYDRIIEETSNSLDYGIQENLVDSDDYFSYQGKNCFCNFF